VKEVCVGFINRQSGYRKELGGSFILNYANIYVLCSAVLDDVHEFTGLLLL